jgi:hypothetical protein
MMLEVLSSFRDGVITHDKKTGTKRLNAKNIRNQASNLLMEVDIPVEIDGVETLVKRPLIRLYSPDLDTITEIEKTLYELASRKDSDAVLTTQEMKHVQDMLNTLIKRTQIEVEFEFGNMQSRTVADIVNQGVGEIEIMRNSKENRQPNQDYTEKITQALDVSFNRLFMTDEDYKEDIARLVLLYGDDEKYKVVHIEMPITYENIIKSLKELSLDELQALTGAIDLMLSMKKQEDI